jgi:Na+/proline symporter
MLGFPGTRIGWWAVGLACTFSAFFALLQILVATGQRGGDTFFANPWLGLTMLAAVVAAMAGGVAAAVAIFWKRERSLLAFAALLIGFLVGLLVVLVLLAPASE